MNSKTHPGRIVLILVFLFLFSGMLIYTDDIPDIIDKLEKELYKFEQRKLLNPGFVACDKLKEIKDFSDFLKEINQEEKHLNLSVSGSYSEDEAGQEKLSRLEINTGINKGYYPRTFQFNMGTTIQFKNKGLLEDVTKLQLSYDHYFSRWLKVYGFAERFADSYLSIRHRYEVGAGIKIEGGFGLTREANEKWKKYHETNKVTVKKFIAHLNNTTQDAAFSGCPLISGGDINKDTILPLLNKLYNPDDCCNERKKDNKKIERIERAFKKRHNIITLGFAVTVLSELEKAEIETSLIEKITDENNVETVRPIEDSVKFPLEAEQRYRLALRPSLVIRPMDSVLVKAAYYHKFPLGIPTRINGSYDFRYHLHVQAKYTMSKSVSWAKKIAVVFEYHRQFDKIPPEIPGAQVDKFINDYNPPEYYKPPEEPSVGVFELAKTKAEKAHDKFQWKLEISF